MPLFEMTSDALIPVPSTTFSVEQILERADLQRLLRTRIDMIADGALVVSEEFGAFTDARRRIDLLGVDRDGRLVVFELKRTADGGHLELQALRYAAMISVMTSEDFVEHYDGYLARVEPAAAHPAGGYPDWAAMPESWSLSSGTCRGEEDHEPARAASLHAGAAGPHESAPPADPAGEPAARPPTGPRMSTGRASRGEGPTTPVEHDVGEPVISLCPPLRVAWGLPGSAGGLRAAAASFEVRLSPAAALRRQRAASSG